MKQFNTLILACSTLALTGTAFSQVAGDECSNALAAAIGNNAFDTTTMTPSANPPADGSCTFLDWGASQDVWFSWTASGTGTLAINLCASAYDTSMVVYENDCTTQVACNDDSCGAQYQSVIPALAVTSGTNYKIRIGGWEAASGAGTMNLAFTDGGGGGGSTPGDECATALTAAEGPQPFDTSIMTPTASPTVDDSLCPGTFLDWGASQDAWFVYTPTADKLVDFSLCDAASYDTSLVLYAGTTCADMIPIACNGDATIESCQTYYSGIYDVACLAGTNYYIRIGGYNAAFGTGTLTLTAEVIDPSCDGATGDCGLPHGGLGCADATCCTAVCALNPLCCIIEWDATCVQGAVDLCGLFFYNCTGTTNDCATYATVVSGDGSVNVNTLAATLDGPGHLGALCASGSDNLFNDVWFKFSAAANGVATVSSCGTISYDNKLAAYDMGVNPAAFDFNTLPDALVGCNDDGVDCFLSDGTTPYASELSFACVAGHSYLVRNGSYAGGDTGTGTLLFTLPTPCALPSASGAEGEACGASTNGGCDAATGSVAAGSIAIGGSVSGTYWADADVRDTDWYAFTITEAMDVTWKLYGNAFAAAYIISGDPCTTAVIVAEGTGGCPLTATACLAPGTHYVWAGIEAFDGTPCGGGLVNEYVGELTGTPAVCPLGTDVCDNAGPDSATQSTSQDIAQGGVACAAAGITVENSYARSFAGLTSGEIRCVEIAMSNSGSSVLGSIAVYHDMDGGDPTAVGADLVLYAERTFNFGTSAAGFVTARFDTPICLDGNTHNIVVVFSYAASTDGFCSIQGNALGESGPTYIASAGCGLANFVTMASIGFPDQNWVVNINGDFAACGGGGNPCPTDLNGDGLMDGADLALLLGSWGTAGGDIDGDGLTNGADLAALLGVFGSAC